MDENFFQPAFPFPVPHSPFPQNLGTDPAIVNKIKGLRGFGGRARAEGRKRDFLRGLPAFFCGSFGIVSLLEVNGLRQLDGDFSIKLTSL